MTKHLWGGFTNGKLDWSQGDDLFGGGNIRWIPAIFGTRKEASKQYEDVRKINISEYRFYG